MGSNGKKKGKTGGKEKEAEEKEFSMFIRGKEKDGEERKKT